MIESSLSEDDLETENNRAIDGLWHAEDYYWNIKRKASTKVNVSNLEVVDWDGKAPTNSLLSTPSRFERLRKNTVERTFRGRDLEHFGDGLEVFHAFLPVRRVIECLVHRILRT